MAGYFLVERGKGPAWDHSRGRREQVGWDEHAAFMDALAEEGFVLLGGPIGEGDGENVLLVVDADSEATTRARLGDDPWPEELLTIESIRPWSVWLHAWPATELPQAEQILRFAYRAFNARDVDAALKLMHPEVDWPNAWEGGRVRGRAAVRDYWNRQFAAISSEVVPERFTAEEDGGISVDVHQVVRDARSGELISDSRVRHRYQIVDGLVVRMDVFESPDRR